MKSEYDAIIIGGGPAGLSAALLLGRCIRRVLVFDSGNPRNASSRALHGFLGHDGKPPAQLLSESRRQLATYDTVEFVSGLVHEIERIDGVFRVHTSENVTRGRTVLLATGIRDQLPDIPSARTYYGASLHHCPYCDGWEHRGKNIGVVGNDQNAVNLAVELILWSSKVVLYTNSVLPMTADLRQILTKNRIGTVAGRVQEVTGEKSQITALRVNDAISPCDALFFSPVQTHQSSLAQGLGCPVDAATGAVHCGQNGDTNIQGLFVAGNVSKGIQMAIMAAAEGMKAAAAINEWLLNMDTRS